MKRKDQFKVLMDVYERRIYLLQKYAPREYETSFNFEQGLLKKLKEFLYKVQHMDDEKIEFILQLFILVSRSWEAFCFDNDGQKRFIQDKDFYIDEIFSLLDDFLLFVNSYFTIKKYQNDNVLNKVKENIQKNIEIIQSIIGISLTFENIELYFEEQTFNEFYDLSFYSFSGYQGQSIYINSCIRNNKDYQMHIEWSIIEGLYYWSIKNNNPFLISSECQKQGLNPYKELGDVFISKINKIYINFVSPFRMNTSNKIYSFCSYRRGQSIL